MMIYLHFILLSILIKISHCAKFRDNYADETSWSFLHPSTRYKKVEINGQMVLSLSTIPMNASSSVIFLFHIEINSIRKAKNYSQILISSDIYNICFEMIGL